MPGRLPFRTGIGRPTTTTARGDGVPASVLTAVEAAVGPVVAFDPLRGGQSGVSVVRVTGRRGRVVVKSARPAEAAFYERAAPALRAAVVGIPEVRATVYVERPWLVLEDIPEPLPRSRWPAGPDVLRTLARLHPSPAPDATRSDEDRIRPGGPGR